MHPLVTSKMLVRYVNLSVFPDSFPKKCMNQVSGFKFIKSVDYFDSKFNSKPISIFAFNDPFPMGQEEKGDIKITDKVNETCKLFFLRFQLLSNSSELKCTCVLRFKRPSRFVTQQSFFLCPVLETRSVCHLKNCFRGQKQPYMVLIKRSIKCQSRLGTREIDKV